MIFVTDELDSITVARELVAIRDSSGEERVGKRPIRSDSTSRTTPVCIPLPGGVSRLGCPASEAKYIMHIEVVPD